MTPVSERTERLCADGLYIEAVRECVHKPPTSEAEFGQFLQVLQYCLLHVLRASPAHFPQFVETVYPAFERDENVMLLLGKTCLQETFYAEAEFFFQKILSRENSDCLIARESLRTVYEVVVPRWHFSMLNDVIRNSSYSHAISNAVSRIPNCSVLDIGSGTGLLSMLAVRAGASRVYACEINATMVTMSHDIIAANGMMDKIAVIHKMSSDVQISNDIPERVCLVVMEIVDAGLLGEEIVPTLRHAWSQLMLPRQPPGSTNQIAQCGHVIPCGATVYVMAIECSMIARQSRLLSDVVCGLSFRGVTIEGSCCNSPNQEQPQTSTEPERGKRGGGRERWRQKRRVKGMLSDLGKEPYTCEQLRSVKGGFKKLSDSSTALAIDFTDPQIPLPSAKLCVPVTTAGNLDAMAMYFDLHLDPTVSISTSPYADETGSWDQAIYPVPMGGNEEGDRFVKGGDMLHIRATCTDTLLHVSLDRIERNSRVTSDGGAVRSPVSGLPVHFVDRGALYRLNDEEYFSVYYSAIHGALEILRQGNDESGSETESESGSNTSELHSVVAGISLDDGEADIESPAETEEVADCIALDMSHEVSILGLMAAKIGVDFVQVGRCPSVYQSLLEAVARNNHLQQRTSIKWAELDVTSDPQLIWGMVLCDVVSPQGILQPGVFEEIGMIRENHTHSDTAILPGKVKVHVVALSSPSLRAQSTVLGSIPTLGLDIARFINKYQISHYIDVDLDSMTHDRLTEEAQLLSIDLHTLSSKPFILEREVRMAVTRGGSLTGFAYWFTLHFPNGSTLTTGPGKESMSLQLQSHWHQAAFCLTEDLSLLSGQSLTLRALIRDSLLDITLLTVQ